METGRSIMKVSVSSAPLMVHLQTGLITKMTFYNSGSKNEIRRGAIIGAFLGKVKAPHESQSCLTFNFCKSLLCCGLTCADVFNPFAVAEFVQMMTAK